MPDPLPRRYPTRSRSQAGTASSSLSDTATRTTRNVVGEKRKALTESTLTLENSRSKPDKAPIPATRTTNTTTTTTSTTSTTTTRAGAKGALTKKPAMRSKSAGLSAAPTRRSARTGNNKKRKLSHNSSQIDAKTICAMTLAHTKKVTFATSPKVALEDKENNIPPKQPTESETESQHIDEETDVLISTSMGALSVKPIRVTKTKLQPPSTGTFAENIPELPALSPMKVRRPKRVFTAVDKDMEDELLCPTSPRLAEKPKRPMQPLGKKNAIDGAELLMSKPKPASALFGSPARRLPLSPAKQKLSSSTAHAQASPSKPSLLSSPARRPVRKGAKLGGGGSSLKFSLDLSSDPFAIPKVADDADNVFGSKSIIERKLPVKKEQELPKNGLNGNKAFIDLLNSIKKEKAAKKEVSTEKNEAEPLVGDVVEASDMVSGGSLDVVFSGSTTPATPPSMVNRSKISPTPTQISKRDSSEEGSADIGMADKNTDLAADIDEPKSKHYRSPSEGGSSFGLFDANAEDEDDMDCDSENVPPPQVATGPSDVARDSGREFGHELNLSVMNPSKTLHYGSWNEVPVDPMLLSEDISDVVIGYADVRQPPMTVPVKFHDDDDDVFGNDNKSTPIDHMHDERSGGVLAGAVVFVDAYTNDGANCGETFEKMLKGMGAKVLKQWSWNPDSATPGKVGITHVVFKDGSPRTLQKVKAARGLVSCVALRWIIECAQHDEWLDEGLYAIDLDDVPRGGHKRRKSMEPQRMDELLSKLSSGPKDRSKKTPPKTAVKAPKTPARQQSNSQLLPKTVPPKFDLGPTAVANPYLLERIKMAKRKSLQFAPKIGSPLVRSWPAE